MLRQTNRHLLSRWPPPPPPREEQHVFTTRLFVLVTCVYCVWIDIISGENRNQHLKSMEATAKRRCQTLDGKLKRKWWHGAIQVKDIIDSLGHGKGGFWKTLIYRLIEYVQIYSVENDRRWLDGKFVYLFCPCLRQRDWDSRCVCKTHTNTPTHTLIFMYSTQMTCVCFHEKDRSLQDENGEF